MKRSMHVLLGVTACWVLLGAQVAGAATSVAIAGTSRSGDTLTVTGSATFDDQAFVSMGTDPANDATTPAPAGQDLTSAAIRTRANGDIEFQWNVSMLPPATNGVPTVFYGWTFCSDEEMEICFDLEVSRFYTSPADTAPSGLLFQCAYSNCTINQQIPTTVPVSVTMTGAPLGPGTIIARVPGSGIGATAGKVITPVQLSPFGAAFTCIWESWGNFVAVCDVGDGVDVQNDYTVPAKAVSLAVGPSGLDPATVGYNASATVADNGSFSGGVNVTGQAGSRTVYARACLGAANCAYATTDVTF